MGKFRHDSNRILVVEDEPTISDVCQRVLTGEGFEVDIAKSGEVALDMIEVKQYDLCLIDIRTPAMNGMELYMWMEDKHPEMTNQVLFTTGDIMGGDTKKFLDQVNRPFLPKPFTSDELKTILKETMEQVKH